MTKQINLHLTDEQYNKIKKIAEDDRRTIQFIVRDLIDGLRDD